MLRFEELAMDFLTEGDMNKRMLTHPKAGEMKEKADETSTKWINPYLEAYVWLKGEILDLKGMKDAIIGRETVMKSIVKCEDKKKSDTTELEKLQ